MADENRSPPSAPAEKGKKTVQVCLLKDPLQVMAIFDAMHMDFGSEVLQSFGGWQTLNVAGPEAGLNEKERAARKIFMSVAQGEADPKQAALKVLGSYAKPHPNNPNAILVDHNGLDALFNRLANAQSNSGVAEAAAFPAFPKNAAVDLSMRLDTHDRWRRRGSRPATVSLVVGPMQEQYSDGVALYEAIQTLMKANGLDAANWLKYAETSLPFARYKNPMPDRSHHLFDIDLDRLRDFAGREPFDGDLRRARPSSSTRPPKDGSAHAAAVSPSAEPVLSQEDARALYDAIVPYGKEMLELRDPPYTGRVKVHVGPESTDPGKMMAGLIKKYAASAGVDGGVTEHEITGLQQLRDFGHQLFRGMLYYTNPSDYGEAPVWEIDVRVLEDLALRGIELPSREEVREQNLSRLTAEKPVAPQSLISDLEALEELVRLIPRAGDGRQWVRFPLKGSFTLDRREEVDRACAIIGRYAETKGDSEEDWLKVLGPFAKKDDMTGLAIDRTGLLNALNTLRSTSAEGHPQKRRPRSLPPRPSESASGPNSGDELAAPRSPAAARESAIKKLVAMQEAEDEKNPILWLIRCRSAKAFSSPETPLQPADTDLLSTLSSISHPVNGMIINAARGHTDDWRCDRRYVSESSFTSPAQATATSKLLQRLGAIPTFHARSKGNFYTFDFAPVASALGLPLPKSQIDAGTPGRH